jgi:hypothetical protein
MKSLNKKFLPLREKDKMKKFSQKLELLISKNFKRKKLHKSLKPREWSKNSSLPKLFKKLKLLLLKKLLPKQT